MIRNCSLVCNHSKRPSGLPYSIKALRYNVIHEKGKRVSTGSVFLRSYFNRVQNLFTLIDRQNKESEKAIGWVFSLKVGSRFEFVILLRLGHLDTVMTLNRNAGFGKDTVTVLQTNYYLITRSCRCISANRSWF